MTPKTNEVIPETVIQEATQLINNTLEVLKPYLIALTPNERRSIPKMSDRSLPFVEKTCDYTQASPQFIPPYLDVQQLQNDLTNFEKLTGLLRLSKQLTSGIDDTAMQAGADGYTKALSYYNSAKQATKMNVPGAKGIHEDLRKRFSKSRSDKDESEKEPEQND